MKALANEIAKNLVLAGIGELTVVDHETVTEEDLFAQFFVTEEDVGKNVKLNFLKTHYSHDYKRSRRRD